MTHMTKVNLELRSYLRWTFWDHQISSVARWTFMRQIKRWPYIFFVSTMYEVRAKCLFLIKTRNWQKIARLLPVNIVLGYLFFFLQLVAMTLVSWDHKRGYHPTAHWFEMTWNVADIRNPTCFKTRILFLIRFPKEQGFPGHSAFCLTTVGILCTRF